MKKVIETTKWGPQTEKTLGHPSPVDACRAEAANCNREPYEKMESEMVGTPGVHFFPFLFCSLRIKAEHKEKGALYIKGLLGKQQWKAGSRDEGGEIMENQDSNTQTWNWLFFSLQ